MLIALAIVGGVALVAALWGIGIYNSLVRARNAVKEAWAQIEVQLKRRHDLIPNLVETARGYMQHEAGTLTAVTEARTAAIAARGPAETARAETRVAGALGGLFAVAERYPDLKANQNFLSLQTELGATENRIGFARQAYNDAVAAYRNARETFPNSVLAGSFESAEFFKLDDASEGAAPRVDFASTRSAPAPPRA